jgi:hypothetical protein
MSLMDTMTMMTACLLGQRVEDGINAYKATYAQNNGIAL